jgi:hypothetical protein
VGQRTPLARSWIWSTHPFPGQGEFGQSSAEPVDDRQGGMQPKQRGVGGMLAQAKRLVHAVGDRVAGDVLVGSYFAVLRS